MLSVSSAVLQCQTSSPQLMCCNAIAGQLRQQSQLVVGHANLLIYKLWLLKSGRLYRMLNSGGFG